MKKLIFCFSICFLGIFMLCGTKNTFSDNISQIDYSKYFEHNRGCAVFLKDGKCYTYNKEITSIQKSPCSTFKIVLTLAGLKYGVLKDENSVIKWDGKKRYFDEWNKDLSLKEAFKLSAVWYFEKVANEIGKERLTEFIKFISYGNEDTSAEIPFWLDSSLKISPEEQAYFLKNLFENKFPIDTQHMGILKQVMRKENINGGTLYGKTGTSGEGNSGWFVGFYEKDNKKIYFAINLFAGENVSGRQAEKIVKDIIAG